MMYRTYLIDHAKTKNERKLTKFGIYKCFLFNGKEESKESSKNKRKMVFVVDSRKNMLQPSKRQHFKVKRIMLDTKAEFS